MHTGNITKIFHEKEYGKIRSSDGEEAHFNRECLWGIKFVELTEGQDVEFEMQPSYNGNIAFHIRIVIKQTF